MEITRFWCQSLSLFPIYIGREWTPVRSLHFCLGKDLFRIKQILQERPEHMIWRTRKLYIYIKKPALNRQLVDKNNLLITHRSLFSFNFEAVFSAARWKECLQYSVMCVFSWSKWRNLWLFGKTDNRATFWSSTTDGALATREL